MAERTFTERREATSGKERKQQILTNKSTPCGGLNELSPVIPNI